MVGFNGSGQQSSTTSGTSGQLVRNGGNFSAQGDNQSSSWMLRRTTTDATPTPLLADGSTATAKPILPNNSTFVFSAFICGRQSGGNSAGYVLRGVIKRGANAAATSIVGTVDKAVLAEDNASWDVTATADTTNGGLNINAIGVAATTIQWTALITTLEQVL